MSVRTSLQLPLRMALNHPARTIRSQEGATTAGRTNRPGAPEREDRHMDITAQTLMRMAGQGFGLALWGAPNGAVRSYQDAWLVSCGVAVADLNYAWVGESPRAEERLRELYAAFSSD